MQLGPWRLYAFVLASALGLGSCQSIERSDAVDVCSRYDTALSALSRYGRQQAVGASSVLHQLVPTECVRQHQALADFAQSSTDGPWRRARDNGMIENANAPPEPSWDVEVWPQRLSDEMMTSRPTSDQVRRLHPPRALDRGQIGSVVLDGRVEADGSLVWRVVDVYPESWGFEDAAVRVASSYRAPTQFEDGRSTLGAKFLTVITFTRTPPRPRIQY